ncbi:hyaluronidase-5-like [Lepisosteus oculatus]|uniref:hyaluronidase-5-like n=1 Tax=Lepisosteus oculatus TaxID=7918 RepID=UPI0037181AD4
MSQRLLHLKELLRKSTDKKDKTPKTNRYYTTNYLKIHWQWKSSLCDYSLPGLAVLDFEEWRPQWIRNWGSKDIYRNLSLYLVMQQDLTLTFAEAEDAAREEFEKAAIRYFKDSLRLGKASKPNRLWGYYLYPDCYNYEYTDDLTDYSGNCPDIEIARNNDLMWLWEESTALYPSIYLEIILKNTFKAALYVRHRIQESMRVSMLPKKNYSIPIYAYIRLVFKNSDQDYLSEFDLVNTIGEAAALGSAGVIAWGDMNVTESKQRNFVALSSAMTMEDASERNGTPVTTYTWIPGDL